MGHKDVATGQGTTVAIHRTTESGSFCEDVAFLVFVRFLGLYIIKRGDLPRGDKHKTSRWREVLFFPSADWLMTSSPWEPQLDWAV
ncbi:hypothetical protein BK139_17345 [Paenibacillus sp. FSL R5-0490]|uniref:hypothetical protein n=1 Tax=Paenibacillus sp. FSL R5-0490 TaxID=1920424 RepID=UPI00096E4A97|nr:hypothetical protein [Paenibacillus sp. FSL R5-0490]OMF55883.1 hypothetical protein BK139_17345 [Paenibacillus sp. FSL R5-0490]